MAIRKVYIGSLGPILYDDTDPVGRTNAETGLPEYDATFPGITRHAIVTDGHLHGIIGGVVGLTVAVLVITDDYTIDIDTDSMVLANATSGEITVTLPTAVGIEGRLFWIKKTDSSGNKVIIDGNGSETIEDELTQELLWKGDSPMLISDNTGWHIV